MKSTTNKKQSKLDPDFFTEQINRLEGAFPNFHLNEKGRYVWYDEILQRKFKGSDLYSAIDSLIEASIRTDNKIKFLDLGQMLRMLYAVRNEAHQGDRRAEKIKEDQARGLSAEDILNRGQEKISVTNREHIKATQAFIRGEITKEEWKKIKANLKKENKNVG